MKKVIIALISILVFGLVQNTTLAQDQDVYFIAYVNRLQDKVKSNWILPHGKLDKKTVILLDINKTGKLLSANIINFSKDAEFDKTALDAVIKSTPFECFPATVKNEEATIKIIFNQSSFEAIPVSNVTVDNSQIHPISEQKPVITPQNNILLEISNNNSTKTADFGSYMDNLQTNIKSNWHPDKVKYSQKTVVLFKIDKSGDLKKVKVLKSSGSRKFDKTALDAIYETAPFNPLPAEFQENSIDIKFAFNYNIVKQCFNPPKMIPYYYPLPTDFSSPVAKLWAIDKLAWLSYLIAHICVHGI